MLVWMKILLHFFLFFENDWTQKRAYLCILYELIVERSQLLQCCPSPYAIKTNMLMFFLRNCKTYFNFLLLLSSIFYIRRKFSNRENFRLPVFTRFGILKHDFTSFTKCLSVSVWHKLCVPATAQANERNSMKFYV